MAQSPQSLEKMHSALTPVTRVCQLSIPAKEHLSPSDNKTGILWNQKITSNEVNTKGIIHSDLMSQEKAFKLCCCWCCCCCCCCFVYAAAAYYFLLLWVCRWGLLFFIFFFLLFMLICFFVLSWTAVNKQFGSNPEIVEENEQNRRISLSPLFEYLLFVWLLVTLTLWFKKYRIFLSGLMYMGTITNE